MIKQCKDKDNNGEGEPSTRSETGAEKAKKGLAALGVIGHFSQLGLSMSICALAGSLGGVWLDRLFGTRPSLLIFGTLLGAAASFKVMYDTALKGVGSKPKKPLTGLGLGGERAAARYEAIRMDARRKADPTRAADRARVVEAPADVESSTGGVRGSGSNGGDGQTP